MSHGRQKAMNTVAMERSWVWLMAIHFAASLAHFVHNAEYIAIYPGMPGWITRETVYLAWLGVTSIGIFAGVAARLSLPRSALLLSGVYGGLGLDGLAHYSLALCSEHTVGANVTICSEVVTGTALLVASAMLLARRLRMDQ